MIQNDIETARVLLVSRDSTILRLILSIASSSYWQLESAANAWQAIERVQSDSCPDLLLLDIPPGDEDGLHILRWVLRIRPALPVILLGHLEDGDRKQEAVRLGAVDYIVMPGDDRQLGSLIEHHLSAVSEVVHTHLISDDVELIAQDTFFIGISPIMRKLRAQAGMLAEANMPALILGEGGSGKETTARLVHALSVRSGFKFGKVNCAALPGDLLERELFGSESDGRNKVAPIKSGQLELCANGTILLDEITEMPMRLQAILLQVIDNKRFTRPGTSTQKHVDVRVLASSTTNMEHATSRNRLREDLYSRLSTYIIAVPPLRERKKEIPTLTRHFMHQLGKHYGLPPRELSGATIEALQAYSWPGNLRELEEFVKRYLMVGDRELAFDPDRSSLDDANRTIDSTGPQRSNMRSQSRVESLVVPGGSDSLRSLVRSAKLETERNAIAAALERTGWNRKAAAQLLKISYRTLLYKIEQHQMRVG